MDEELLKILACPKCKERPPLIWEKEKSLLICSACGKAYPLVEGIPNFLDGELEDVG